MSNKESRTQKLIFNWIRPHGLIRRELTKRRRFTEFFYKKIKRRKKIKWRRVEYDSVKSSYTNKKATKLSRLVLHKNLLFCPISLIINNALIEILLPEYFRFLELWPNVSYIFTTTSILYFLKIWKCWGSSFVTRLSFQFLRSR